MVPLVDDRSRYRFCVFPAVRSKCALGGPGVGRINLVNAPHNELGSAISCFLGA